MYKVFYNDTAIFIGQKQSGEKSPDVVVNIRNREELSGFVEDFLRGGQSADFHLKGYSGEELFSDLKTFFLYMEAAGGLVKNDLSQYLFIRRFGIWDLPKGKIEKNESPAEAALREVEEETGSGSLKVMGEFPPTYHFYPLGKTFVLKKTFWFSMFTHSAEALIPQQNEEISEAVWLDRHQSLNAIKSSYRSLRENFLSFFSH